MKRLFLSEISTTLGIMTIVADDEYLFMLKFTTVQHLLHDKEFKKYEKFISLGRNNLINHVENEISQYLELRLQNFTSKVANDIHHTDFQKKVWLGLQNIPYGKTMSYIEFSKSIGIPNACRAVANAISKNPVLLLIPCHRVILNSGKLGKYSGGAENKKFLIENENLFTREL